MGVGFAGFLGLRVALAGELEGADTSHFSFARSMGKHFGKVQAIGAKAYPKAKRFTHTLLVGERV